MTRQEKDELYDKASHIVTDYETDQLYAEYAADDLYEMLATILCNWDELTNEDY